jgi:hypothetical protein
MEIDQAEGVIPANDKPMMTNTANRASNSVVSIIGTSFSVIAEGGKRLDRRVMFDAALGINANQ